MDHHTPDTSNLKRPSTTRQKLAHQRQRIEHKEPAKAAAFMAERIVNPTKPVAHVAEQVGLSKDAARLLDHRLKHEYAPLAEEVELMTQDVLEKRLSRRLNALDRYMTDERLDALFQETKLKDLAVMDAIYMDKWLAARSTPVSQVTPKEQDNFDSVLKAIGETIQARGLNVTATERKLEVSTK